MIRYSLKYQSLMTSLSIYVHGLIYRYIFPLY